MTENYCTKCNTIHGIKTKVIEQHKAFLIYVSNSELFARDLKKNFKNYKIEQHKKAGGSNKQ